MSLRQLFIWQELSLKYLFKKTPAPLPGNWMVAPLQQKITFLKIFRRITLQAENLNSET